MFDFSGKTVLVTGGTRGIGLAIATSFAQAGAQVHITGTRDAAGDYKDDLSRFTYHQVNVLDIKDRAALHTAVSEIDVLVNNAGLAVDNEYELENFMQTMEANLNAPMDLCVRYRDALAARGGSIINVGSVVSFRALKNSPGYTASKAGILGLTRALADKWAGIGIRVNMLAPGFVHTDMTDGFRASSEYEKKLIGSISMKRWGRPDEMSGAVLFLASPMASYITGATIPVDGGYLLT